MAAPGTPSLALSKARSRGAKAIVRRRNTSRGNGTGFAKETIRRAEPTQNEMIPTQRQLLSLRRQLAGCADGAEEPEEAKGTAAAGAMTKKREKFAASSHH